MIIKEPYLKPLVSSLAPELDTRIMRVTCRRERSNEELDWSAFCVLVARQQANKELQKNVPCFPLFLEGPTSETSFKIEILCIFCAEGG